MSNEIDFTMYVENKAAKQGAALYCISLRDWFAGQAMQGCIETVSGGDTPMDFHRNVAQDAYAIADAMLAARKTGGA